MAIHEVSNGHRGSGRTGAVIVALVGGTGASGTLALLLLLRLRTLVTGHADGPWRVDAVTEIAVTSVGALAAAWLACSALVATVCLLARAAGARWRAGERLVQLYAPQVVRKALVLAVGAGLGLSMATGASAAGVEPAPAITTAVAVDAGAPDDLGWVVTSTAPSPAAGAHNPATPMPTPPEVTRTSPADVAIVAGASGQAVQSSQPTQPTQPAQPAQPTQPTQTGTDTVVVAAGDTLWAITARHLPPDATDAQIAAAWPRWYEANRAAIGADPDVIRPGQVLAVPVAAGEVSR